MDVSPFARSIAINGLFTTDCCAMTFDSQPRNRTMYFPIKLQEYTTLSRITRNSLASFSQRVDLFESMSVN